MRQEWRQVSLRRSQLSQRAPDVQARYRVIGLSLHQLSNVLDGSLDELVQALIADHQARKLNPPDAA